MDDKDTPSSLDTIRKPYYSAEFVIDNMIFNMMKHSEVIDRFTTLTFIVED